LLSSYILRLDCNILDEISIKDFVQTNKQTRELLYKEIWNMKEYFLGKVANMMVSEVQKWDARRETLRSTEVRHCFDQLTRFCGNSLHPNREIQQENWN